MQMVIRHILLSCECPGTHCMGECATCVLDVAEREVCACDRWNANHSGHSYRFCSCCYHVGERQFTSCSAHKYNTTLIFLDIQKNYEVIKEL